MSSDDDEAEAAEIADEESAFDAELRQLLAEDEAFADRLIDEAQQEMIDRELTSSQRHVETFAPRCGAPPRGGAGARARPHVPV
jgi:hypothetical protein